MRDLSTDIYEASVQDGDEVHVLSYRRPTNQEHAAYGAALMRREGGKLLNRVVETRVKFGLRILTGFKKGSLGIQGKPISSDENDPDYYADWKNLLEKYVPDVVAAVGRHAFEGTQVVQGQLDFESEIELDDLPLPSTSPKKSKTS